MKRPAAIIGFTGYAGSGKDTAADALVNLGYIRISFADRVREMLGALDPIIPIPSTARHERLSTYVTRHGWDSAKRDIGEVRELLQRLGTEAGRNLLGENVWVDPTLALITPGHNYVIPSVRFNNEAERIRQLGGYIYRIDRPGTGPINSHATEHGVAHELLDGIIPNNTTITGLQKRIARLINP